MGRRRISYNQKNITYENLVKLTEKLRSIIENYTFPIIGHKTASFGVTLYHAQDNAGKLVARADEALYLAKSAGRNCTKII